MDAEAGRWRAVRAELERLLELPRGEREPHLVALEPELAAEVRRLLALEDRAGLPEPPGPELWSGEGSEQRVGPYRLVHQRGRRAGRSTWLAARDDGEFRRLVELVLAAPDAERSERERRWLARLDHPAVPRFLEGGSTGELDWLAFEHVEGVPLARHVEVHGLGRRERLAWLVELCEAVARGHEELVPHGDLHAGCVRVSAEGRLVLEGYRPDLAFGDAAAAEQDQAPERRDGGPADVAGDVWSLGLLARELLAPFERGPRAGDLEAVLARATERAPGARHAGARELAADLRALLEHRPVAARAPGPAGRVALAARRRPVAAVGGALLVVLLAVAGGLGLHGWQEARRGREVEERERARLVEVAAERGERARAAREARMDLEQRVAELEQLARRRERLTEELRTAQEHEELQVARLEGLVRSRLHEVDGQLAGLGPGSVAHRAFLDAALGLLEETGAGLPADLASEGLGLVARRAAEFGLTELEERARAALQDVQPSRR